MKNYKDYSNLNRSRYALKIPYNTQAKALIFGLRIEILMVDQLNQ